MNLNVSINIKNCLLNFRQTAINRTVATALLSVFMISFYNSAFAISISKEREIAVEFMEAIEMQDRVIKDRMALSLVSEIGEKILKAVPPQPFKYSFYIVNEDQFNAFAGPGSNIFVHRGLITSLDNVDELAGIIGHEIAHSSCRHISDMIDQSKIMTIGTLAGVLAGVLVGSKGGGGGDFGQAVLIGSVAAGQTAMLSYSREHETEADQKGLIYLTKAGFDPKGLLTGLEKIRSRDWFGSEHVPDYLKTHPGSTERIVQIQSWIEGRGRKEIIKEKLNSKPDFSKNTIDPFKFQMVKYRLSALYGDEYEAEKLFNSILQKEPDSISVLYGMALLMERKNRLDDSMKHLRKALELRIFDPYILLEMGKINILKQNPQKALEIMQGLETIAEVEIDALFYISEAALMTGSIDIAEKGFQKIILKSPELFPKAYYYLAKINGESSNNLEYDNKGKYNKKTRDSAGLSHYYLALYYYEMKNMKSAKIHFIKSLETLSDQNKRKHAQVMLMKSEIKEMDKKMKEKQNRKTQDSYWISGS